jgi:hypothetical protein
MQENEVNNLRAPPYPFSNKSSLQKLILLLQIQRLHNISILDTFIFAQTVCHNLFQLFMILDVLYIPAID